MNSPRNRKLVLSFAIVVVLILLISFFALRQRTRTNQATDKVVKIGLMPGGKQEDIIWKQVQKNAKEQEGITLKFVNFTDGD